MLDRWLNRDRIHAFHERDIEKIVRDLGLYEKISSGELMCSTCSTPLTLDTIECLYMQEDCIKVCCNNIECYEKVIKEQRSV